MISDYNWAPIGIACSINDDVLPETTPADTQLEYADVSTVSYGSIGEVEEVTFRSAPSRARRLAQSGDVVVSTVRTYLRAIAAVGEKESNYVFSTGFAVLRPRKHLTNSRYLSYAMGSTPVIDSIINNSNGVGYPAINPTDLLRVRIPLPSLQTQHRIAVYLDRETQHINESISRFDRVASLLEERSVTLLQEKLRRGHSSTTIGRIADLTLGNMLTPNPKAKTDVSLPYIRAAHIQPLGVLDLSVAMKEMWFSAEQQEALDIKRNDVLIVEGGVGGYGRAALVTQDLPGIAFQNSIIRARVRDRMMDPRFLTYSLILSRLLGEIEIACAGAGMPHFTVDRIARFPVPSPKYDDQVEIADELDEVLTKNRQMIEQSKRTKALFIERRAALITAAVTGKIEV